MAWSICQVKRASQGLRLPWTKVSRIWLNGSISNQKKQWHSAQTDQRRTLESNYRPHIMTQPTTPSPINEFSADSLQVAVYSTRRDMGRAAAIYVAEYLQGIQKKRDEIRIVVGSAPSQDEFYEHLTASPQNDLIDWTKVVVFHTESIRKRCNAKLRSSCNDKSARSRSDPQGSNIHGVPCHIATITPQRSAFPRTQFRGPTLFSTPF